MALESSGTYTLLIKKIGNYINQLLYWETRGTFTLKRNKLLVRGTHNSLFLNIILLFYFCAFYTIYRFKNDNNYFYYSIIDGVYGIRPSDDS